MNLYRAGFVFMVMGGMASFLGACSTMDNPMAVAGSHLLPSFFSRSVDPTETAHLNPQYRYLRLVVDGRPLVLAQPTASPVEGSPWFSATGEVLRFRDGRVVGATGLLTEWRSVQLPNLPSWTALEKKSQPLDWTRVRDVMPAYRYGITDHLRLQPMPPPKVSRLKGLDPRSLWWFREQDLAPKNPLPPAWYGVDPASGRVIYGAVCLDSQLCFTWQRWPVGSV
ncbi:MAG: YjbF family lipoprotein [Ferrovum sp.]|nr:YjbF family lipoprotein [Ferrovum sp.]